MAWFDGSKQHVSILTRPEGRVQLALPHPCRHPWAVSILTRPEGRVQRPYSAPDSEADNPSGPDSVSRFSPTALRFTPFPFPGSNNLVPAPLPLGVVG